MREGSLIEFAPTVPQNHSNLRANSFIQKILRLSPCGSRFYAGLAPSPEHKRLRMNTLGQWSKKNSGMTTSRMLTTVAEIHLRRRRTNAYVAMLKPNPTSRKRGEKWAHGSAFRCGDAGVVIVSEAKGTHATRSHRQSAYVLRFAQNDKTWGNICA